MIFEAIFYYGASYHIGRYCCKWGQKDIREFLFLEIQSGKFILKDNNELLPELESL